jgi:hypothetical protein
MKSLIALVGVLTVAVSLGQAAPVLVSIPGIVSSGAGLAEGATDVNFLLISAPAGVLTGISPKVVRSTVDYGSGPQPAFPLLPTLWAANDANSQWLSVNDSYWDAATRTPGASDPSGWYVFLLVFQLPSTYAAQNATIIGSWAADNRGQIYLNGNPVSDLYTPPTGGGPWGANTHACGTDDQCYMAMHAFEIDSGFQAGTNYLEFHVWNGESPVGNPTGFRFDVASASYAVPEPSTLALWLGGLAGLALLRRCRRKAL